MNLAYFDCFSGAGGDMIVASLLDAGADGDALKEAIQSLGLSGYTLSIERVRKPASGGLAATRFDVELDRDQDQPHRHLAHIVKIIEGSALSASVRQKCVSIFRKLAEAEAKVHGTTIEQVHFHEVGAVDAIIDVVGAVYALELLSVDEVICSPIPTGSGTVDCAHGTMPVPAPATAELLVGVPLMPCEETGELITPTGAAVLTTLSRRFGSLPQMTLRSTGYGAGTREGKTRPNLLRVLIGEVAEEGEGDTVVVLETNLDDTSPEIVGHCMERLMGAGALDAFSMPIQMKKSRPGVLLTVLCEPETENVMRGIVFAETSTLGIRRRVTERVKLVRHIETVVTRFGTIHMKVAMRDGAATASPEYEDCKSASKQHQIPLQTVMAEAQHIWRTRSET